MADRVHEHPDAGLSLGGQATSPECHDSKLCFVDIDWFNQRRLHSEINGDTYVMPAEFERS